jgi:hypothetical protein
VSESSARCGLHRWKEISVTWKQVSWYNLGYIIVSKQFYLYYMFHGERTSYRIFDSLQEFVPLTDMFRNEGW